MNFFTNRIVNPAGNGPSFEEWFADFLTKQASQDKTASEAKPGLGLDMSGEPRGQQRGQVINNDNEEGANSYQEGESVDGKKEEKKSASTVAKAKATKPASDKVAHCGKEMGESDDAGKVTEKHTEAGPGDDENPEPKVLINNDPNYQKGESTKGGKGKSEKSEKKEASVVAKFEKVASMDRKKKLQFFAILSSSKKNTFLPVRTAEGIVHKPSLAYVEAMVGETFANMQEDEKSWFKDFWKVLYPEQYVEEMVADR